ncbi:hypothetical protein [Nonomuraea sp. SYSU D8015]|uniref:hypothetical protein n=1 Tax=Nonomuraea sp. SYSU D8015 TaxID=2593644 RepID=UPI0016606B22|nr:hypothetical protein [Nonomuraea sp. SYSU D8015]
MGLGRSSWRQAVRGACVGAVATVLAGTMGVPPTAASTGTVAPPEGQLRKPAMGRVATDGRMLNVRSGPGTGYAIAAPPLADGARVQIYCVRWGEEIQGLHGPSRVWNKIDPRGEKYVADALVFTGSMDPVAPPCKGRAQGAEREAPDGAGGSARRVG